MNESFCILLLSSVFAQNAVQSAATGAPALSPEARAEIIRKGVIENRNADRALFDAVIALGRAAAPEIKPLLTHSKWDVKRNALHVLIKMPDVGPEVVREALRSPDYELRSLAVGCGPELMKHPEVVDAFIECFMAEPRGSQIVSFAIGYTLLRLEPDDLKRVADKLIPRVLAALNAPRTGYLH
jgi:hypothetical protein